MLSSVWQKVLSRLIALLLVVSAGGNKVTNRIVGGRAATIANFPYMVYLQQNGEFYCGGTLISSRHVLTAAHCIRGSTPSQVSVVAGATFRSQPGVRRQVTGFFTHPRYNYSTRNNDIAVLKLAAPLNGNNITPIGLCASSLRAGNLVSLAGWGTLSEVGGVSAQLRTAQVSVLAKSRCVQLYRGQERLTSSMFCAAGRGRDSCQGDSGGPVVFNGRVCGVISWGIGCARNGFPGVYTSVQMTKAFIRRALTL